MLADSPIVCSVVVLRPPAGRQVVPRFFTDDDETYATGLMFLAERLQRFLGRGDKYGAIVLDSRRPEADERMRRIELRASAKLALVCLHQSTSPGARITTRKNPRGLGHVLKRTDGPRRTVAAVHAARQAAALATRTRGD